MRDFFEKIRKHRGIILGFLLFAFVGWAWGAPAHFKATWRQNPVVAHVINQQALVNEKSKAMAISYYYPHFPYLTGIATGAVKPEARLIECYHEGKPYIFHTYYQKAADLFDSSDAAHYLLGFCEFYVGQTGKARMEYEKALKLNPQFFWAYYNLALIYYQQGDYALSATLLKTALSLNKNITLEILHQTFFYRQIWKHMEDPPQVLAANLKAGIEEAMLLLAACYRQAGLNEEVRAMAKSIQPGADRHHDLWADLAKGREQLTQTDVLMDRAIKDLQVRLF